ncbi:MAG: TPR repeat protein [Myxococcota bacterium]
MLFGAGCDHASSDISPSLVPVSCEPEGTLAECVSACDGGHAASCAVAATALQLGEEVPRNQPRAADLFEMACARGDASGCGGLGAAFLNGHGRPRDDDWAVAHLKVACKRDVGASCGYLGLLQRDGRGGLLPDADAATALWKHACDLGHPGSCRLASVAIGTAANGGEARDPDGAVSLLRKACRGGDRPACARVFEAALDPAFTLKRPDMLQEACSGDSAGACHALAKTSPTDSSRLLDRACELGDGAACRARAGVDAGGSSAVELLTRACKKGDAPGCLRLAEHYRGEGETEKTQKLHERACEFGSGDGCARWADTLDGKTAALANAKACELGEIPACMKAATSDHLKSYDRARLTQRACAAGLANGCTELGLALEFGRGLTTNFKAAFDAYRRACEAGDPAGCVRLGVLFDLGQGVAKSRSRATGLFKKSCEHGEGAGCTFLGAVAVYDGHPYRGRDLLKKGCKLGHKQGCVQLAKLESAL